MKLIQICASPEDLLKLCKRVAAFRPASPIWCQIARDHVWTCIPGRAGWCPDLTEVCTPSQVDGRIDNRALAKIGVSASSVIEVGRPAASMATIAVAYSID